MFGNDSEKGSRGQELSFKMLIVFQYHCSLSPLHYYISLKGFGFFTFKSYIAFINALLQRAEES